MSTIRRFASPTRQQETPVSAAVDAAPAAVTTAPSPSETEKPKRAASGRRGAKPTDRSSPPDERVDHYQDMTDRIVEAIESGVVPWRRDWNGAALWPRNGISGRPYHGINVPMLLAMGFQDDRWATFNQAKAEGWHVRKGERGAPIYFHMMAEREVGLDPATGEPEIKRIPHMRRFRVFNFSQIEGAPAKDFSPASAQVDSSVAERIDDMVAAMGVEVVHGYRVPMFEMSDDGVDRVCMPDKASFHSDSAYFSALMHEVAHWTGHPVRLNRVFGRDRTSPDYAREELRAELCSAMLCARLGVPYALEGHAGYLEQYLKLLRGDKREIYRASRDAERIANFVLAHHPDFRDEIRQEAGAMAADAKAAGLDLQFDASDFDYDDDVVLDIEQVLEGYTP